MVPVGAASRNDINRRSHRKSEFGSERIPVYLILLDRLQRNMLRPQRSRTEVIFSTIDCKKVVAAVAAANREAGCRVSGPDVRILHRRRRRTHYPRQSVDGLGEVQIDVWQIVDLPGIDRVRLLRLLGIDQQRLIGDFDYFANLSEL